MPILAEEGVVGVIAAYHPTLDYIYSEHDVFFLQNIAHQVAGLLRALKLADANKQLEDSIASNTELKAAYKELEDKNKELDDSRAQIAEQQHILTTSLLSQDFTHRINNSIGSIVINLEQSIEDLSEIDSANDELSNLSETLEDSALMLRKLITETSQIMDESEQSIDILDTVKRVAKQVMIGSRLDDLGVNININRKQGDFKIKSHGRLIFNTIHAIIDNAADAIRDAHNNLNLDRTLFIKVNVTEEEDLIIIEIEDNGLPIPFSVRDNIFKYGISSKNSSGFGLWRANSVITSLGGKISIQEKPQTFSKVFSIEIPKERPNKLAYILDDEPSWIKIISNWLSDADIDVKSANNKDDFIDLLNSKKPDYVFLDISLDTVDGANVDGLSLIKKAKEVSKEIKIVLVTGRSYYAKNFQEGVSYDLLIEKVDKDGEIVSKKIFLKKLSGLS